MCLQTADVNVSKEKDQVAAKAFTYYLNGVKFLVIQHPVRRLEGLRV